jgi:hypothetical protein
MAMKHAVVLPTGLTLCGLPSNESKAAWVFSEEGMLLKKGSQSSLFEETVTCEECKEKGKSLIDDTCPVCGR